MTETIFLSGSLSRAGLPWFKSMLPAWPGDDPSSANPDVAVRPAGVVEKCTLCQHRIRAVLERARIDDEPVADAAIQRLPACAAARTPPQ